MLKICKNCNVFKSLDSFPINKTYTCGLASECKACRNTNRKLRYINNKEKEKLYDHLYRSKNRDKINAKRREFVEHNLEFVKQRNAAWKQQNKDKVAFYAATYRAKLKSATPAWLTETQKNEILEFYKKAEQLTLSTNIKHHVDHIEPLNGANSTGLHVPWNLQVIPHYENESKGNKLQTNQKN